MANPQNGRARTPALWLLGLLLAGVVVAGIVSSSNTPTPTPAATTPQSQVQTQQPRQSVSPENSQDTRSYQPQPQTQTSEAQRNTLSNDNYYTNSDGNVVHSPAYSNSVPAGATAQCNDGTYSFSQHRQGTCSNHGGVEQWLY